MTMHQDADDGPRDGSNWPAEAFKSRPRTELATATPANRKVTVCQNGVPRDSAERKACPILRGVLEYFPDAIAAVANVSFVGNEQHNPGQPMHWSREKSNDHGDCIARHLTECGTLDTDGLRHSAKIAWRALALLQLEIERHNHPETPR